MKRILFICSGNMYRSAGAEVILRKKLIDAGISDWEVDSAGTLELGGIDRPEDFGRILAEHDYVFGGHTKYVFAANAVDATLILVMEPQHRYVLRSIVPEQDWGKIRMFMDFCFGSRTVLTDPSGFFNEDLYRETRDTLERGCDKIVQMIKERII